MSDSVKYSSAELAKEALKGFNSLREREKWTDLVIVTNGNHELRAHRVVMAARFPKIESMLPECPNQKLLLTRFNRNVIEAALDFAYSGEVEINNDTVIGLYLLACNLGCDQLINWCICYLKSRLSMDNAMDVWVVANCTRQVELLWRSWLLLRDRFEAIHQDPRFEQFTDLQGVLLICSEDELEPNQRRGDAEDDDDEEAEEVESAKSRFLASWIEARRVEGDQRFQELGLELEKFVAEKQDIKSFSFDSLMSLNSLAFELRVSRACKNGISTLLKTARSRSTVNTEGNLKGNRGVVVGVEVENNRVFLRNIEALGNRTAMNHEIPWRDDCRITSLLNWVVVVGGHRKEYSIDLFDVRQGRLEQSLQLINKYPCGHSVTASNGLIFIFAGNKSLDSEALDIKTMRSFRLPRLDEEQENAAASPVGARGVALVGGGGGFRAVRLLKPPANRGSTEWTWLRLPDLLQERDRPAIAFVESRQQLFVAGGNLSNKADMEVISFLSGEGPRSVQVTALSAPPNLARWGLHLLELDDRLTIVSGGHASVSGNLNSSGNLTWKNTGTVCSDKVKQILLFSLFSQKGYAKCLEERYG